MYKNLDKEQEEGKVFFLSSSKWALLSLQLPGYLGFKEPKFNQPIWKNRITLNSVYSLILLIGMISWNFEFFRRASSFNKYLRARGPTEVYAFNIMFAYSSFITIFKIIFGLTKSKKLVLFWQRTHILLSELLASINIKQEDNLSSNSISDNEELVGLAEIGRQGRRSFLSLIIPILIHVVLTFGYRIWDSVVGETGTTEDTQLAVGLAFSTLFTLLGSGISIWLIFFIQVYTSFMESIEKSVKGIYCSSTPKRSNQPWNSRRKFRQNDEESSIVFYIKEIRSYRGGIASPIYSDNSQNNIAISTNCTIESKLGGNIKKFYKVLREIDYFNEFYGNVLLLEIGACVISLLVYSFFALIWLGRGEVDLLAEGLVPIYVFAKELYELGTFSDELTQMGDMVVKAIAECVDFGILNPQVSLQVQILVTQVLNNPPAVSAKQFFHINRSLITSIVSALATFLVVLVQFRDADSN